MSNEILFTESQKLKQWWICNLSYAVEKKKPHYEYIVNNSQ